MQWSSYVQVVYSRRWPGDEEEGCAPRRYVKRVHKVIDMQTEEPRIL
jgi:hypothetical protein